MSKTMARGTVYLLIAQVLFLGSGFAIHFGLGRLLGPEDYGIMGLIFSLLTVIEVFLIRGFRDAVSKYVSEFQERANAIKRSGIIIEILLAGAVTVLYVYFAENIALLFNDLSLTPYIKISAIIIPIISIYSIYLGYLSGKRSFGKQALAMSVNSIGKVFCVYALFFLGFGIFGVIEGYSLGILIALLLVWYISIEKSATSNNDSSGDSKHNSDDDTKFLTIKIIRFALPLIIFSAAITLLMNLDLLLIKALTESNALTGLYTTSLTITRIPYYLFFALSFTLLPSISKSTSNNDLLKTQEYITKSLRYLLLLVIPVAFFISGASKEIIAITYSSKYIPAATSLSILIFGMTLITIFYTLTTIITGSGKPQVSMAMATLLVPLDILLNLYLIPQYGLEGAAIATTVVCLIGVLATSAYVKSQFGVLISLSSFLKITTGGILIFIATKIYVAPGLYFIPYSFVIFIGYLAILYCLHEVKNEDIDLMKSLIPRNRAPLMEIKN